MLNCLRNFLIKEIDDRVGRAWVTEVLPVFHDRGMTTNKDVWVVKKIVEENIAEVFELEYPEISKKKLLMNIRMITQGGEPVKFSRKGKLVGFDKEFSKGNYRVNEVYYFTSLGYLGNYEDTKVVHCVTDEYVFFMEVESNSLSIRTYQELERLCPEKIGDCEI